MPMIAPRKLSPRHKAWLREVAQGKTITEVAKKFSVSRQSVYRIYSCEVGQEYVEHCLKLMEATVFSQYFSMDSSRLSA